MFLSLGPVVTIRARETLTHLALSGSCSHHNAMPLYMSLSLCSPDPTDYFVDHFIFRQSLLFQCISNDGVLVRLLDQQPYVRAKSASSPHGDT